MAIDPDAERQIVIAAGRGRRAARPRARRPVAELSRSPPQGADPRRLGRHRRRARSAIRAITSTPASRSRSTCRRRSRRSRRPRTSRSTVVFEDDEIIVIDKPRGPGGASRRRQLDRHAGQRADRPLRRQPVRHRRGAAARHRAPARQGHDRPDGGGQDRPRPPARSPRSSPTTAAPARCSAAIWPSSGARRTAPRAPSTSRSTATRRPATKWRCAQGGREAITHWEVLERYPRRRTRGRRACSPAGWRPAAPTRFASTWRTIGHPLLGDDVYGPGFKTKAARLPAEAQAALAGPWTTGPACLSIGYRTPHERRILEFRSELPADLGRLHHALGATQA